MSFLLEEANPLTMDQSSEWIRNDPVFCFVFFLPLVLDVISISLPPGTLLRWYFSAMSHLFVKVVVIYRRNPVNYLTMLI